MNGQDWLNYWQAHQQPDERKADWLDSAGKVLGAGAGFMVGGPAGAAVGANLGGAAGGTAEDAVNGGVTLQDLMRLGMAAAPVAMPFNLGFAAGGAVPDVTDPMFQQAAFGPPAQPQASAPQGPTIRTPQDAADFLRGLEDAMGAMPGGTFTPEAPKHPTLEMLASVVPDVVKALPVPRQTNSVNKTVGAWLPAAAVAFSAPIKYGQAQREDRNKRGTEAARELANRRWAVAKSMVDSLDTMKSLAGSGGPADQLTPEQYDAMGVPPQFRTAAGYKAWLGNRARSDQNVGRLALAARTNKDIAQFPDIRDSYARIKDAAASGWKTGVGDMALVFSFMRLLDPTSVVREGEYERARKTAGIPGWVWGMYQNVANGKFITPEQRSDMVRLSQNSYKQKLERYRTARGWLNRLAKAYSVNPDLAIPDLELPGTQLMPEVDPTVPQPAAPDGTTLDEHGVPIPNGLFQPVGGVK